MFSTSQHEMSDVDAYARGIQRTHVPTWGKADEPTCRKCGTPWPCIDARWQEQWLTSITRFEAERHR